MDLSRRNLLSTVGSVAVWSLCGLAVSRRAVAATVSPVLVAWLREVDEQARSLKAEGLSQAAWQSQMEALYGRVPFPDLLKLVDLLVSSFLVLQGELYGRHFDRLRDEGDDRIVIAAASDRSFGPGDCSTVSQDRNNVHWFTATKDRSFVLDLGVASLEPAGTTGPFEGQDPNKSSRIYLDLDPRASSVPGTISQARRLTESAAYRRYG
jgi:hypothetical protein